MALRYVDICYEAKINQYTYQMLRVWQGNSKFKSLMMGNDSRKLFGYL